MKKKIKLFYNYFILILKEEYKFIIFCTFFMIFMLFPLNYYIYLSGDISNANNKIEIEDSYNEKGSFNISYVNELDATIATYLLSFIIPDWEREKIDYYKLDKDDSIKDIEFRDKLELNNITNNAMYWGYTLAGEKIKKTNKKVYVIFSYKDYPNELKVGDQILSINNVSVNKMDNFSDIVNQFDINDYIDFKIKRNNKIITKKCKIYNTQNGKKIGIVLKSYYTYNANKKIKFKFKNNEKGPSGGLITTLEIFNKLTKKDYTNGLKIAGTGTIEEDGTIGEIGGVKYKVKGAAKRNVNIFFVPDGNYKECIKVVKDNKLNIKVVKVKRIEDAINYLKKIGDD